MTEQEQTDYDQVVQERDDLLRIVEEMQHHIGNFQEMYLAEANREHTSHRWPPAAIWILVAGSLLAIAVGFW